MIFTFVVISRRFLEISTNVTRALFARVGFASTSYPLWRTLEEIYLSTWKIEKLKRGGRSVFKVTGRHESVSFKAIETVGQSWAANRRHNGNREIHERVMR